MLIVEAGEIAIFIRQNQLSIVSFMCFSLIFWQLTFIFVGEVGLIFWKAFYRKPVISFEPLQLG